MGKFIPVDPDRWAELVKAAGERDALVVEVRRLDAEVARLTDFKAKADQSEVENARLKAEVERLTKAGDAIYQSFDQFGQVDATTLKGWNAAKGVQS
jgi:hypothetical protein